MSRQAKVITPKMRGMYGRAYGRAFGVKSKPTFAWWQVRNDTVTRAVDYHSLWVTTNRRWM